MENQTHNLNRDRQTTAAERLEMVERFRGSGKTRRAFCESEGVAKSTLDWWLRKSPERPRSRKKRVAFREPARPVEIGRWKSLVRKDGRFGRVRR